MKQQVEKSMIKDGDLEKINRYAKRELTEDEVYIFTATLCDNDIDRDNEKFSTEALYALAPLFVGKTVITDHSMKSGDQMARIFETYVEQLPGRQTADGETLCALKGRAYMLRQAETAALIEKIEAGITKEGSVSCSMGKRTCSVCGKDITAARCEHRPPNVYNGRRCFTILSDPRDAYEFSFVAVPAQKNAGVTKAFHQTKEALMDDLLTTIKAGSDSGITLTPSQAASLTAYLERLEDEANLGKTYKKELSRNVCALLKEKLPAMDAGLIQSVVSVMTAEELIGFRKGLQEKKPPLPQLAAKDPAGSNDYSPFMI